MKKKCLLIVSVLLFSLAGFAQGLDLLGQFPFNASFDKGNSYVVNDDGSLTATFVRAYSGMGWMLDGEDYRAQGYNGVTITHAVSTFQVALIVQYRTSEDGCDEGGAEVGPGEEGGFPCIKNGKSVNNQAGQTKVSILFNEFDGAPVHAVLIQNGYDSQASATNPKNITVLSAILQRAPVYKPNPITLPIDNEKAELTFEVPGAAQGPANPITHVKAWGWPGTDAVTVVNDPAKAGKALYVQPAGYQLATFFLVELPAGKTFSDAVSIEFDAYFSSNDTQLEGDATEVYKQLMVIVAPANEPIAGDMQGFSRFPATYVSYDDEGGIVNFGGLNSWNKVSLNIAQFSDPDFNRALTLTQADFPDGSYTYPANFDMSKVNGLNEIQLGIGVNMDTPYYIDNIRFHGNGLNVEKVVAPASAKVAAIEGGLTILGGESAVIYGVDGRVVATTSSSIALPKGVYIVKVGGEVVKAIVK